MASASSLAGQLNVLLSHRLVPFSALLQQRELISADLARVAAAHAESSPAVALAQVDEERRVLAGLAESEMDFLVVKGTALAATVYEDLRCRIRTDMDMLVAPASVEAARRALKHLGYQPTWAAPSAVALKQEQWSRRSEGRVFSIDLHWDLRNHPVFYGLFEFDELMADSIEIPRLGVGVRGLGFSHALLLSVMHWYVNAPDERALIWLLDSELLWNGMDRAGQEGTMKLAGDRGLSGLLGDHLRLCREWMSADISVQDIEFLERAGRDQRATGLIGASRSRGRWIWFELVSERGMQARLGRLWRMLFPSAVYMRQCFPDGSRFGLPGLYAGRLCRLTPRRERSADGAKKPGVGSRFT